MKDRHNPKDKTPTDLSADRKRKIDLIINERKYKIRDFLQSDFAMNNNNLTRVV
jgi:hypothetical protein